ncbi:MAG: hypothetical protein M9894_18640 [Planctomycetes bacterium]|nr:hypothetical protein [Planctomycetota bacterium]
MRGPTAARPARPAGAWSALRALLLGLGLAAAAAPGARAQDVAGVFRPGIDGPRLEGVHLDGGGRVVRPPTPEVDDLGRDPDLRPSLDPRVDVRLELPSFRWLPRATHGSDFVRQVSLTHLPPGSLIVRYDGLEGFVVRKVQARMRKLWRDSIRDAYDAEAIDWDRYDRAFEVMHESFADHRAGGRWWERSWLDSLTPERGGAPANPFVQTIGQEIQVARLGPLSLSNELRVSLDRLSFLRIDPDGGQIYRDHDVRRLAREHAHLRRDDADDPEDLPAIAVGKRTIIEGTQEPLVRITLEPPDPGLLPGYWRLRLRPMAAFRVNGDPAEMLKEVSLRVTMELFIGEQRRHFMNVEAVARFQPADQEMALGIELSLLTW